MSNALKVTKYLYRDLRTSITVFFSVMIAIVTLPIFIAYQFNTNEGEVNVSGLGATIAVYIFIMGLNIFKSNFKFMQMNNITRSSFYFGSLIALISLALFLAIIDALLNKYMKLFMSYQGLFEQIYPKNLFIADVFWSFSLFTMAVSLGWLITMLYYRSNKLTKIVISIAPVLLLALAGSLNNWTNGSFGENIWNLFSILLGLEQANSYMAVLSFSITALIFFALSYLLIRKSPLKN